MSIASSRGWARLELFLGLVVLTLGVIPGHAWLDGAQPRDLGQPLPILEGDTWRYLKGTAEPPAVWATIGFDDSGWPGGPSGFGYGDGDDATVLADMQNGYLAVYTRKLFEVPNPAAVAGLELRVDWDDGFVAFLNGQEIARRNLAGTPGTPVAHDIPASSHEAGTAESIAVPVSALVAGTNALAVQVHNVRLDSSDLSLVVELRATNPPPAVPTVATPADGTTGLPLSVDLCVAVSDPNDPSLTVTFHGRPRPDPAPGPFTIIALPDTQYYSESYPATYAAQTQWIVTNLGPRNIAFVTELGDCVNVGATEQQWIHADAAWDVVEDPLTTGLPHGVPFGIAVGNHDQSPIGDPGTLAAESSTTPLYNQYFGVSRFAGRPYYGGHYGSTNDNHYELFTAGGMEFVALHLEYMPSDTPLRQAVLAWANQVLQAHPNRRAIVTAHYLINPSDASWSNQGQATWDALKANHNLFLMLCGHLDQANRRYDEFTDATGTTRTHTLVSDFQSRPNGGNGWLRILTFSPDADTIDVSTYSPTVGTFIDGHADNTAGVAQNRFTLAHDMPGGGPFGLVGTTTALSGAQACATWSGLTPGTTYEWYAVASDGTAATTGDRATFDTTSSCVFPSDCDDADPCTDDDCVASTCQNEPRPDCCSADADCADGDPCTDDVCQVGTCDNPFNTAPCDDGDGCTVDDVCGSGVCAGLPSTCDDGNACTVDACGGGACANVYSPTPGCCTTSDDCDDGDLCSADVCGALGDCTNTPAANCCDSAADCDDGEPCTTEACEPVAAGALAFDGVDDYVTMGPAAGPTELGATTFTIETWFHWTGGGAGVSTGTGGIAAMIPLLSKGTGQAETPANVNMNYLLGIANGRLAADFEDTASGLNHPVCTAAAAPAITTGAWHHAAAAYDGTCWTLYLDGIAQPLDTACSSCTGGACTVCPGAIPESTSIQHFGLGTSLTSTGTPGGFFQGRLDEARVWDVARTQSEIDADRGREIVSASNLIGRWGLDDGDGNPAATTAADSGGRDNPGTLTNGPGWSDSPAIVGPQTCSHAPVAGCCHADDECGDASVCTADACEGITCEHVPVPGCCVTAEDCDDADPCTADACAGNACSHAPIPGCDSCADDSDCADASGCTADYCPATADEAALLFDGIDDYVTMGAAAGPTELGATSFTVETWFYWTGGGVGTSTGSGGIATAIPLVSKGAAQAETPANVNMNYLLGISGGRLVADFEDAASGLNHPVCTAASAPAITTNAWHHAAAVYDGSCWVLYLDGTALSIDTACSTCAGGACTVCPGATPESTSIQHFGLGTSLSSSGTPAGFFHGRLDEVRVWNVARTVTEIQASQFREVPAQPGLIGSFGLDDGAASPGSTTALDASGRENPGTLVGGPSWSTTSLPDLGTPGICAHAALGDAAPECCRSAADCDDADPCTADSCGADRTCANLEIAGCVHCTADLDCDDANECTSETCDTANDAALAFDGVDDFVTMGAAPGLGATTFTVEAWFQWTGGGDTLSTGTGGLGTTIPLVAKGRGEADGSNRDTNYYLGLVNGRLAGDFEDTATGLNHPICTVATQPTITTNVWHHAAAVYDGTCWALYLDGVSQPLDTACSTCSGAACTVCPGATPRADSIQHFAIGAALQSSLSATPVARDGAFAGRIDEVRVWNVARAADQIAAAKDHEIVTAPGLIGRFSLSDGTGLSALDSTSPAENGTLCGGAAGVTCTGTNVPFWSATARAPIGDDLCDFTPLDLGQTTCGVGACERTVDRCLDGQPQACVPGAAGTEVCDGLDNDCDGGTDEDRPAEVTGVAWTGSPRALVWSAQGGALVYDLVGDTLTALRSIGVGAASCLAHDVSPAMFDDARPDPAPGAGYYYLVRSRGPLCGSSTWGYDSLGTERLPLAACP